MPQRPLPKRHEARAAPGRANTCARTHLQWAGHAAEEAAAGRERLVTLAVSMEDPDPSKPPLPPIALHRGETPEEVANAYCDAHGLDKETVVPQVAKLLGEMLEKALAAESA